VDPRPDPTGTWVAYTAAGSLAVVRTDGTDPRVLAEPDGPQVSWTVVDQLGTAGGVENRPTVNHFSTPDSAPLKPLSVRLQYFNTKSGLQTGYVSISCGTEGDCTVSDRVDVGLPGGEPQILEAQLRDPNRSPLDPMNWPGLDPESQGAPGP